VASEGRQNLIICDISRRGFQQLTQILMRILMWWGVAGMGGGFVLFCFVLFCLVFALLQDCLSIKLRKDAATTHQGYMTETR
jgi:hypothetical protein